MTSAIECAKVVEMSSREHSAQEIFDALSCLENKGARLTAHEVTDLITRVLHPLLVGSGFFVSPNLTQDYADLLAINQNDDSLTMPIEIKHRSDDKPVGADAIRQLEGYSAFLKTKRCMIVSTTGFSREALQKAERIAPIQVLLRDLKALRQWAEDSLVNPDKDSGAESYLELVRDFAQRLAREIAKNPAFLMSVEWRDLERVVAEVFSCLGFEAELTPPAKDGGRDVLLFAKGPPRELAFLVEAKHWTCGRRVGGGVMKEFVRVVLRDKARAGLLIATSGFAQGAYEALSELDRQRLAIGGAEKVHCLCRTYIRRNVGLWRQPSDLSEIVFADCVAFEGHDT